MSSKPGVRDLFTADSDDEDHLHKRPRSGSEPNTAINEKVKEVADKLADFVAKNGRKYEDMTRDKNPGNTPFKFLWDKSSKEYKYYENRLHTLLASAGGSASKTDDHYHSRPQAEPAGGTADSYARGSRTEGSSGRSLHDRGYGGSSSRREDDRHPSSSRHDRTHSSRNDYDQSRSAAKHDACAGEAEHRGQRQQQQQQQDSRWQQGNSRGAEQPYKKRSRWGEGPAGGEAGVGPAAGASNPGAAAADGGATLSAMEQYMRRLDAAAAQKRQEEIEEEEERRRRAAQPLLKETAFDRRKVVAVYKDDGERGHHMGDYIPKEELAKFMAQCGNTQLQQQVESKSAIGADNIGHKLLQKMGWKEGKGIGAREDGNAAPVAAAAAAAGLKQDTLGLGAQAHGAVQETDDPFEQYRKRMMLGYKYRPNPLGNPRRSYY